MSILIIHTRYFVSRLYLVSLKFVIIFFFDISFQSRIYLIINSRLIGEFCLHDTCRQPNAATMSCLYNRASIITPYWLVAAAIQLTPLALLFLPAKIQNLNPNLTFVSCEISISFQYRFL